MSKKITAIKGMEDLYEPEATRIWQKVETVARQVLEPAGFQEIRTPIVEDADLFERSVGETTDIVSKEMYTLRDRNEKRLALRPEGTASVVRAFIEHFTNHNILDGRFYYTGPMYRYERPQKGRLRQFHQIGVELFGSEHPLADAEMISLAAKLFSELKITGIKLELNSLGSRECRENYQKALRDYLKKIQDKLSEELRTRAEKNPLRLLDSKDPKVAELVQDAPSIIDSLSAQSQNHFKEVQQALKEMGIEYEVNPRIVRGLDYYEHTVFEFIHEGLGSQNAIAAGGRYNDLVSDLGGPKVPAVGFALGMERLVSMIPLEEHAVEKPARIYLIGLDEEADRFLFPHLASIREMGAVAQLDLGGASLKSKLKRADRWGAEWAIIQGAEERKKGIVVLRNMQGSTQEEVPAAEIFSKLMEKFPTQHYLG